MIDYLLNYVNEIDFKIIKNNMSKKEREIFSLSEENVIEILNYLKDIGVTNFKDILILRKDICFKDLDVLKEEINKINKDLIVRLFNDDVSSLINLNV